MNDRPGRLLTVGRASIALATLATLTLPAGAPRIGPGEPSGPPGRRLPPPPKPPLHMLRQDTWTAQRKAKASRRRRGLPPAGA